VGIARLDRPWHRPGAVWHALLRLKTAYYRQNTGLAEVG
jgi:hypothetical protein